MTRLSLSVNGRATDVDVEPHDRRGIRDDRGTGARIVDDLESALDHLDVDPGGHVQPVQERVPVVGFAHGAGGDGLDALAPKLAGQRGHAGQRLDPVGIAARSLQECLIVQLEFSKAEPDLKALALRIMKEMYEDFTMRHFEDIGKKLLAESGLPIISANTMAEAANAIVAAVK